MQRIRPALASIIDELDPSAQDTFIKVRYPFGTNIVHQQQLTLPTKDPKIIALLSYAATPLGLIMGHAVECYVDRGQRTVPLTLFSAGDLIGVWERMPIPTGIGINRRWPWNIAAGTRSLLMLPKITDSKSHQRLCNELGIQAYVPKTSFDHWTVFTDIAHTLSPHWCVEMLFFSEEWIKPRKDSAAWQRFYRFCFQEAWQQSLPWRNKLAFDFFWDGFDKKLSQYKLRPTRYQMNTVKQLIQIGMGALPGFIPSIDEDTIAPVSCIQNAYQDIYGMEPYAPLLLQPHHLSLEDNIAAVYYSLNTPTLIETPAQETKKRSVMEEIKALKPLLDLYLTVMSELPEINNGNKHDFLDYISYEYFHSIKDPARQIKSTATLLKQDNRWEQAMARYKQSTFPNTGPFLRGCVQVNMKT